MEKNSGGRIQAAALNSSCAVLFVRVLKNHPFQRSKRWRRPLKKIPAKTGEIIFAGTRRKSVLIFLVCHRRIVVDFEVEDVVRRLATVVPVFFADSFACCSFS